MTYVIAVLSVSLYGLLIYFFLKPSARTSVLPLAIGFFFGVLAAMIALSLEYVWNYFLAGFIASHPSLVFLESFIGVSLIEEAAKWIWLASVMVRWEGFKYYSTGVLYACCIGGGFNMVESLIYASIEHVPVNMLARSVTAVPVHFLFAISMGFLFSRYRFEGKRFFWLSLAVPVILHGLYDFFILQSYSEILMGAALLVLVGSLFLSIWIMRIAVRADKLRIAVSKE